MINHVAQRPRKTAARILVGLMVLALDIMIGIQYNFLLRYADPQLTVGGNTQSDVPLAPSLSAVLETLGLKLDSGKVPGGCLIIDHIERPTEN